MESDITSVKNPRIKDAMRLRDRRGRNRQRRIIVDGLRECLRAMDAGLRDGEAYICPEHLNQHQRTTLDLAMRDNHIAATHVTDEVFRKLAYGNRAEGVILVTAQPDTSLQNIQLDQNPLVGVLEGVEKPGNLGAVVRTADAAGVSAVIVVDGGTDLYNPNAIRASLGAIFKMPIAAGTAKETVEWLRHQHVKMFATRVDGAVSYTNVDFRKSAAIILGSETLGLSNRWRDNDMQAIAVPMLGVVDSLNVSATAAVLFYEAVRQRCQV